MGEQEMFKTTIMGGFDKEDVLEQVQKMKDDYASRLAKMKKELEAKEAKIAELIKRLELKDAQQARMEEEIHNKYQKYIERYDSIGRLVFEAQVKSEDMITEAEKKSEEIISQAEEEARRRVDSVQSEIDDKLAEGKKKYLAVQDEMNGIVELINQAQKRFMASYKEVHQIISTMPTSLQDIEDERDVDLLHPMEEMEIDKIEKEGSKEIHLGDTQELEVMDALDSIADLDEYDAEDEINDQLVNKIQSMLGDDLEDELEE